MDVVADAGAVVGIVVIAVDAQEFPAADGNLGDVGHQVVGNSPGIFADTAGDVGADGIEVTQQNNAPLLVGMGHAGKDLLGHILGPAVGVGAVAGLACLPQRHHIVTGIDGGRGGEDDLLAANLFHDLGQHQGGVQVVVIVTPGLGNGFANSLQTGEVDDSSDLIFCKDPAQQGLVSDIALIEFDLLAGELFHPVQALGVGVAEIVDHNDTIAAFQQLNTGMGTNIAGTAGNQNVHGNVLLNI